MVWQSHVYTNAIRLLTSLQTIGLSSSWFILLELFNNKSSERRKRLRWKLPWLTFFTKRKKCLAWDITASLSLHRTSQNHTIIYLKKKKNTLLVHFNTSPKTPTLKERFHCWVMIFTFKIYLNKLQRQLKCYVNCIEVLYRSSASVDESRIW